MSRSAGGWRGLCAAWLAVGMVAVAIGWVGAAPAAAQRAPAVRVVVPVSGAITTGGRVRVRVRLSGPLGSLRARLNGQNVTSAFARSGVVRAGGLRRGLRWGRNRLSVSAVDRAGRRWYALSSFVRARPLGGLIVRAAARSTCTGGAALTMRLARPGLRLRVTVNRGTTSFGRGGTRRTVSLDADHGLVAGANVITVRALDDARGQFSERRLRLRIGLGAPIAGAGASRRTTVGTPVRLSATSSVGATRGARLYYRWAIISRPRGSRSRLRDAGLSRPALRPDRPGRYVLRVTVSHQSHVRRWTAGRGKVRGLCAAAGSSTDTVTVDATVLPPAIGVPVQTIVERAGQGTGVDVQGAQADSYLADHFPLSAPGQALQMVVLDRQTLALISNTSYTNDDAGAAGLLKAVQALATGASAPLVIITKPRSGVSEASPSDTAAVNSINQALSRIGAHGVPASVSLGSDAPCPAVGACSVFSAIGVPGLPAGQGYVNPGLEQMPASGTDSWGDLSGDLVQADNGEFTFVNRERVELDTGDPTADPATVTVGSEPGTSVAAQSYTSARPAGEAGFYVLVLDAGSLTKRADGTFDDDNAGMGAMHTLLSTWENDPSVLVVIRSIGAVARVDSGTHQVGSWDAVAGDVRQLGGSGYYFDALNGDSSAGGDSQYSQVGPGGQPAGYPSAWTQVASHQASIPGPLPKVDGAQVNPGRLTGLLARNPQSQFYPSESTTPGTPLDGTITGLISEPTTSWPDRSGGDGNVVACIAAHINPLDKLTLPIESYYTNENYQSSWASWANQISPKLNPDEYEVFSKFGDCQPFSQSQWTETAGELSQEFSAVPLVWAMFDGLKQPYIGPSGSSSVIGSAAATIAESLNDPSATVTVDPLEMAEDVLWIASAVPIPGVSNFANAAAGAAALALAYGVDSSGALPDITGSGAELAANLQATYNNIIEGLGQERDIVLSDPAKLLAAGKNAGNTAGAVANWSWGSKVSDNATARIGLGAQRLAYQTLFPTAYRVYKLTAGTGSLSAQDVTTFPCEAFAGPYKTDVQWKPFTGVPRFGGVEPTVSGEGSFEQWVYATPDTTFLTPGGSQTPGKFPSQSLVNSMFVSSGDAAPLFNPLQFAVEAYADASRNYISVTHTQENLGGIHTTNEFCTVG